MYFFSSLCIDNCLNKDIVVLSKISVFKETSNLNLLIRQTGHLIIYIIDVDLQEGVIRSLKASWLRVQ